MANILKPFVNWVATHYGDNVGKMLIHTGVVGWILSSAAQVVAIVINDEIPKKQKMYMIPQEIADAAVNIVSFYLITQTFKGVGSKLVNTGRWLPNSVRKFFTDNNVANVGKKGFDVLTQGNLPPEKLKDFTDFRDGMDVLFTTAGSILSCNIVTPIVRNEIAARRQKRDIARMEAALTPASTQSVFTQNQYFKRPTIDSFKSNAFTNFSVYPPNSGLKI